jgi:hypothetical protein
MLVSHSCNPSYSGAKVRRVMVRNHPLRQVVLETLSQKKPTTKKKKKKMAEWLKLKR